MGRKAFNRNKFLTKGVDNEGRRVERERERERETNKKRVNPLTPKI